MNSLPTTVIRRRALQVTLAVTALVASIHTPAQAQFVESPNSKAEPLMVFGLPTTSRILEVIDRMTVLIGREDVKEQFVQMVSDQFAEMSVDPDAPMAQMFFLKPGFPPELIDVFCSPVTDEEDFAQKFKNRFRWVSDGKLTEVKDKPGMYEFSSEERSWAYRAIRLKNGYAMTSGNKGFLELNLEGIEDRIAPVVGQNDLGFAVFPEAVPSGLRSVFINFLRNSVSAELQRRDGEDENPYRMRKATGEYFLDLAEEILNQSDGAGFGLDFEPDGRVRIEGFIDAMKDSGLAEFLSYFGGRPSQFRGLTRDDNVDWVNISFMLDEATKKWLSELVAAVAGQTGVTYEIENFETHPIHKLFDALQATLAKGHFDFVLQASGQPRLGITFIAAMKIEDGTQAGSAIRELLKLIETGTDDFTVEYDAEEYGGIQFQRITPARIPKDMRDFFGDDPSILVGAGQRTIWLAVGGAETILELSNAVDIAGSTPSGETGAEDAAIKVNYNLGRWMPLSMPARPEGPEEVEEQFVVTTEDGKTETRTRTVRRNSVRESQRRMFGKVIEAIKDDEDNLKFVFRSSESGVDANLDLGPAFTKMYVTLGITGYEMSQERQREAQKQREEIKRREEEVQRQRERDESR